MARRRRSRFRTEQDRLKHLIRRARMNRRLSVATAARECGISEQLFRNYENGRQVPTVKRLEPLANVLGADPFQMFRAWAAEAFDEDESPFLHNALCNLHVHRNAKANDDKEAKKAPEHKMDDEDKIDYVPEIIDAAYLMPMDPPTSHLTYRLIQRVAEYRKGLMAGHGSSRDLCVKDPPMDDDAKAWLNLGESAHASIHRIGMLKEGMGFLNSFVRIDPGSGVYHRSKEGTYADAGFEFFSVIRGKGSAYFEDHAHPKSSGRWINHQLRSKTSGHYRSGLGHAFVNHGKAPMIVFVVVVPFPAEIQYPDWAFESERADAQTSGTNQVIFSLENIQREELPKGLCKAVAADRS